MDILNLVQDILLNTKKQYDKLNELMDKPRDVDYVKLLKSVAKCRKLTDKDIEKKFGHIINIYMDDIDEYVLIELMLVALVNACSIRIFYQSDDFYYSYIFFRNLFNRIARNLHMAMPFVIIKKNAKPKNIDYKCEYNEKNLMKRFMLFVTKSQK